MTNSRRKGKDGELELAHFLEAYGYATRRGQQYSGSNGDADVVGVPGLFIECKRCQQLNINMVMAKAVKDARPGDVPVIMHRTNNAEWKATLRLKDFMEIWRALDEFLQEREQNGEG